MKAAAGGLIVLGMILAVDNASAAVPKLLDNIAACERDARNEEQTYMDLDAVAVAVTTQEITGDYLSALYVLGSLLQ